MERTNRIKFEQNGFGKRLKSMLKVDFRRMFTMPFFYIMAGICLVVPILILVMTSMMDGSVSVDPTTGAETVMQGFENTWQAVESVSGASSGMSSDMMSMCNINLIFFGAAVLVCKFVSDDFKSGYAKNLFAVRSKKSDYVISKTLVGFVGGAFMILAYFIGAIIGGTVAGLSFDAGVAGISGIIMCLLSKVFLMSVFVPIYVTFSVVGKQKLWMSLVGSLCVGTLFFMMIPMLTPLNSGIINVIMCLIGGAIFSAGLGAVSNKILQKTSLV